MKNLHKKLNFITLQDIDVYSFLSTTEYVCKKTIGKCHVFSTTKNAPTKEHLGIDLKINIRFAITTITTLKIC